ncbi:GntR family transcriptional regulator [Streptomyces sp. NBC_01803]|uniref:GntR family transcriptional regulator n=1 Tax=Streptomyces sp. NBC_01803 TaxID=2975946 RepID=UPI002DD9FDC7|nr:GntR family transcriptional regulator [Streptomyces sp. NBC_01803]WSA43484.1 GntR family transcriptional regulator [Streptomyces sp. NBC_01803]
MDTPLYTALSTQWSASPAASPASPAASPSASPATPRSTRPSGRGDRRGRTYAELRRMLLDGEFGPRARLVEVRLAKRLGVSRTPVREALVRLVADGLVERHPDGYYAARPDLAGLRDLYELRVTVELRGIARAMESGAVVHDAALLEPLRDTWRALSGDLPGPDPGFVSRDEDFHHTLLRASGNPRLTETLESVTVRVRPMRMYDYLTEDRVERTVTEHLEIVEHVLAGRLPEAHAALHHHVGASLDVVAERAARAITRMALGGDR